MKLFALLWLTLVLIFSLGSSQGEAKLFSRCDYFLSLELAPKVVSPRSETRESVEGAVAQASRQAGYVLPAELINRYFSQFEFSAGQIEEQVARRALNDIYMDIHFNSPLERLILPYSEKKSLQAELESMILQNDILSVLGKLGLINKAQVDQDTKRTFWASSKFILSLSLSLTWAHLTHTKLLIPKLPWKLRSLSEKQFASDVLSDVRSGKFDEAFAGGRIKLNLSMRDRARFFARSFSHTYKMLASALAVGMVMSNPHLLTSPAEFAMTESHTIMKIYEDYQIRHHLQTLRQERWDGWREGYKAFNGRYPDPQIDKVEWDYHHKKAFDSPASDFRTEH